MARKPLYDEPLSEQTSIKLPAGSMERLRKTLKGGGETAGAMLRNTVLQEVERRERAARKQ